jgi:hypothetical protein
MPAREPNTRHSDLGPSSKDWQPGSPGRDEDFTPEKDLWTLSRKGNIGQGRPGEDLQRGAAGRDKAGGEIQPGTAHAGPTWQSRRPDPDSEDDRLDQALKDSFPASDPPEPAQPGVTGWDLTEEERTRAGRSRAPSPSFHWLNPLRRVTPGWLWIAAGAALASFAISAARRRTQTRRSPPPQA